MFTRPPICATLQRSILAPALLLLLLLAGARPAAAQDRPLSLPPGWSEEIIVRNLGAPTAFALAPDGRIYVALKAGRVKVIANGLLQNGAFIDLTAETNSYADRGLMGIALHPDFPNTPWVYLAYVWEPQNAPADGPGRRSARVVRVSADPANLNLALPDTLQVLVGAGGTSDAIGPLDVHDRAPFACAAADGGFAVDCLPVDGPSHTVDALRFGPDGALYISSGDATLQPDANLRAQSLDSLAGKVLRVDASTGAALPDNPYFDNDQWSNRSRIFALGMRNPFRFAFAPDGRLTLGDVGAESWEEINRVPAGANLGWPCFEGPMRARSDGTCAALATAQVTFAPWSYPHEGQYSAAIAGDYLPTAGLPAPWAGAYIYGDHNRAALLTLPAGWESGDGAATEFATNAIAPVQITTATDGSLYLLSFITGALSRLTWVGGNNAPPIVAAAATPISGELPLTVAFSSQGTSDPDADPLTLSWDLGDGGASIDADPVHTYTTAGRFEVRLTATDSAGASRTVLLVVSAGNATPQVSITQTDGDLAPAPGDVLSFRAVAIDAEEGALPASRIQWRGVLHHNEHTHVDYANDTGAELTITWDDHGDGTWLELCASAADAAGLEGRACVALGDSAPDDFSSLAAPAETAAVSPSSLVTATAVILPTSASDSPSELATSQIVTTTVASSATATTAEPSPPVAAAPASGLLLERWAPIDGDSVADLTRSDAYDGAPDETAIVETLRLSGNGKDYGQRLRGWLTPTTSGATLFWLAADDGAELWLGTDASPESARLIAAVPGWSRMEEYDKYPEQSSAPQSLEAGRRYYIEIRHKQADQRDGLTVAWQPPGASRAILAGAVLTPWK